MVAAARQAVGIDPLALLDQWSIEITAKDAPELVKAAPSTLR